MTVYSYSLCVYVSYTQCLWSPLAFAIGSIYIAQWELEQIGLQWSNINQAPILDDHLSFIAISFLLMLDVFLYFLIAWYLEGVFPGRYGVAKHWYFPFMPSYWCGHRKNHKTLLKRGEETSGVHSPPNLCNITPKLFSLSYKLVICQF